MIILQILYYFGLVVMFLSGIVVLGIGLHGLDKIDKVVFTFLGTTNIVLSILQAIEDLK